jgi:surface antigen
MRYRQQRLHAKASHRTAVAPRQENVETTHHDGRLSIVLNGNPGIGQDRARCVALLTTTVALLAGVLSVLAPPRVAAQSDTDEDYVVPLVNQVLETEKTGVEVPWTNPATGSSGSIVIERTFYRDPRTPCRDYRRTIERPGGPSMAIQGTGCRVRSGRWSLEEEEPDPAREALFRGTPREPEAPNPPASEPESAAAAPSCPALTAVPVPCARPAAVADYTMPTRTEL